MEKERFLDLARNFTSLSAAETADIEQLKRRFPYSQVIHSLSSRGSQDNALPTAQSSLQVGAVYSTDRAVLKSIISSPRTDRKSNSTSTPSIVTGNPSVVELEHNNEDLHGDDLINEVMQDLFRLRELKHDFEMVADELAHRPQDQKPVEQLPRKHSKPAPPARKKPSETEGETGDPLLDEIKTSRKKVVPESPRQKEQIEIIDKFIKKQPSIGKAGGHPAESTDLAQNSISLTDNLVSETLVEILLRQGKKDKAIEVLRKLIWKFPQKKAIFAAQIEELRK